MFTDIVGFTTLGQTNESLALQILEDHRALVRPIVAKYGGKEVKTIGDAFLVEVGSALEAVKCAVEIQRATYEHNSPLPEAKRIQIRIGIHVGDVVHAQGDILGDAVNVSSRIEPLAEPGGVCISGQVYDHVENKLGLQLEKLEDKTLKNVRLPVQVYKVVMPWEMKPVQDVDLDRRRIAVLPLKNMSPDPNDEYFADGMTEELITSLSSLSDLTVIARTSVMQYKNAPKRIADVAKELSVGTIVEGSVRKAGTKVRITIQLIDARNEGHLWAQNYDKQLDDVFTVQSEVAGKVAEALKVKLADTEKRRMERGSNVNPEAYNVYLKGMFYWNKRTPDALRKAADLLQDAVKLDPTFAMGYAGLAQTYQVMAANYHDDPEVYFHKAKEYALKALSLDDDLAEAHTVLAAEAISYEHDWDRAESEFKRAIELNPSFPTAHQWYSHLLGFQRRFDEGWAEITKALELSPLSLIINTNLADGFYYKGKLDKAIEQAKKVIEMDPNFEAAYPTLIQASLLASRHEEAEEALAKYARLCTPSEAKLVRAYVDAFAGRKEEARKALSEVEEVAQAEKISYFPIALAYFKMGDIDKGFQLLEKTYLVHDRYIHSIAIEYELDEVRSDPRYLALLEKVGLKGRIAG
jgi:adenylate cyclase